MRDDAIDTLCSAFERQLVRQGFVDATAPLPRSPTGRPPGRPRYDNPDPRQEIEKVTNALR